ncbi:MAG: glycerate kinase, partial [Verrucomicrobiae bacterium]|nr:glycerate kinase [Verrucomicrobiae bacterium]
MTVLVAPDKFKGTLDATQAAEAIASGWRQNRPDDSIDVFPISDGGDGFGELLGRYLEAETRLTSTVNAAHEPITAPWWWVSRQQLAIIESARVIGLAQLPPGRFHPFELDTRGLAQVLQDASQLDPRLCLVGIGGSATNDAGFGMALGLGWRFFDRRGRPIKLWTDLYRLVKIERPGKRLQPKKVIVAVDVQNPLLGSHGATRIYGPQKGIRPEDIRPTERNLRRLVRV